MKSRISIDIDSKLKVNIQKMCLEKKISLTDAITISLEHYRDTDGFSIEAKKETPPIIFD